MMVLAIIQVTMDTAGIVRLEVTDEDNAPRWISI